MKVVKQSAISTCENLRLDRDESVLIRVALITLKKNNEKSMEMLGDISEDRFLYLMEYYQDEINKIDDILEGLKNPLKKAN